MLHGEFALFTVILSVILLEATFCTKFIKIRDKNSVPTYGAYYIDYKLKVANRISEFKEETVI